MCLDLSQAYDFSNRYKLIRYKIRELNKLLSNADINSERIKYLSANIMHDVANVLSLYGDKISDEYLNYFNNIKTILSDYRTIRLDIIEMA